MPQSRLRTALDALARPRDFDVPLVIGATDLAKAIRPNHRTWRPDSAVLGSVLSHEPPILALRPMPRPFGAAPYFAERFPEVPFVFLVGLSWSLEGWAEALALSLHVRRFRRAHPACRLIILTNTEREQERLAALGVEAHTASHLVFVDDTLFQPLPGRERRFDALCNARLAPYKRHHLARLVPSCAHITMVSGFHAERLWRMWLDEFLTGLPPGHAVLNRMEGGRLLGMHWQEVSEACAASHVGLCLSRVEGAMNASIEYLFSGLPVVSTRSWGGRDRFFHPDTAIIVRDDPREVRDAVAALKARAIPPEAVRATTLALVTRERERFNAFLERLGAGPIGGDPRFRFPFHHKLVSDTTVAALERRWMAGSATSDRRAGTGAPGQKRDLSGG